LRQSFRLIEICLTFLSCGFLLCVETTALSVPNSPPAQEGFVTTPDGVRLFYQKVGAGKQVVIIPAGFFLFDDFQTLAKGRTLIFYDMRDRGRSIIPKSSARKSGKSRACSSSAIRPTPRNSGRASASCRMNGQFILIPTLRLPSPLSSRWIFQEIKSLRSESPC
jgi:hypothetical protein